MLGFVLSALRLIITAQLFGRGPVICLLEIQNQDVEI